MCGLLLAQGDTTGWWVGVLGALGGLLVVAGKVALDLLAARARAAAADRGDVWTKQGVLIDRLDKQLAAVQAEQQRALVAEMACREEVARLRATGQWLYDLVHGLHAALERSGATPEPLPGFPDFAALSSTTRAEREFSQRTMEHRTALLRQEVRENPPLLPPHPPDAPGGAAGPGGGP
jgi:hypothetical protein